MTDFLVGEHVVKKQGAYSGSRWSVQGHATNRAGKSVVICESYRIDGLLHIFGPDQLIAASDWEF